MKIKRVFFHFCLALALLMTQHGGYWHALSHYSSDEPAQQENGLPDSKTCPLDAVYAQVASGMSTGMPLLSTAACSSDLIPFAAQFLSAAQAQAPHARAPPTIL